MLIGTMLVEMYMHGAMSLKDKRAIVKSLKAKIRNKFNVSIAEVDFLDKWQRCSLGLAIVANEKRFITEVLAHISNFFELDSRLEIIREETEIL